MTWRRKIRVTAAVVACVILTCCAAECVLLFYRRYHPYVQEQGHPCFGRMASPMDTDETRSPPVILAHRGSRALNPENTISAHRSAIEMGADILEFDVSLTKDEELVVFHDYDNISALTNTTGTISDYTVAQLANLDVAYWYTPDYGLTYPYRGSGMTIPTLHQFLAVFENSSVFFNIEIKGYDKTSALKLYEVLEDFPMLKDRLTVVAVSCDVINYFRRLSVVMLLMTSFMRLSEVYYWMFPPQANCWELPQYTGSITLAHPALISTVRSLYSSVYFFVVNSEDEMRYIYNIGADGLITDRVDVAHHLLEEMGWKTKISQPPKTQYYLPIPKLTRDHTCTGMLCGVLNPIVAIVPPIVVMWGIVSIVVACLVNIVLFALKF
ncbi:glycerophosphodiester phosphodiesterase [Pelomyxa schiedti]|nr:glycerophosphodiester phosphodiesterase [Pelomyxa schiedti]